MRLRETALHVAAVLVATASPVEAQQKPGLINPDMPLKPRIVGQAKPATDVEYGSVVAINYQLGDRQRWVCTGVLLTSTVILTAGHCGCGASYTVNVHQDSRSEDPSQLIAVTSAPLLFDQRVCRDGYMGGGNDLALIRLPNEVALSAPGQSTLTADISGGSGYPGDMVWGLRATLPKGTIVTAIGYGFTNDGGIGMRMQGDIPIFSFDCEEPALAGVCSPFSEMILAQGTGPRGGTDTCGGDSGGPVFWFQDGRPRLLAITSRAAPGSANATGAHCGGGGIYTLLGRLSVQRWLQAAGVPAATR
jgi:trypsin